MLRIVALVVLGLLLKQCYTDYTSHQVDELETTQLKEETNPKPIYEGIVRLYNDGYMCSAVVISRTYALTAAHCATNWGRFITSNDITVRDIADRPTHTVGKFIALDHERDLALLKGDFKDFKIYIVNTTYSPKLGEPLLSCGLPNDSEYACQSVEFSGNYYFQWSVHGASLQHGDSGGPTFNMFNEVVGINSAVADSFSVISPVLGLKGLFGI